MIEIDEEFQKLIPPLTDDEFRQLEENCVKEGIRDPLVVWEQGDKDILVDGHNRWKISTNHGGIQFQIVKKQFKDRDEVKKWIICNQFGRRNLSAYDRSLLALKLKPMMAEKAKANQGSRTDICQKSDKSYDTKKELAKIAGVSHDTIHKVEKIEAEATPQTKEKLKKGELSINQAYNSTFPKVLAPVREAKERHEAFQEKAKEDVVSFKDAMLDKYDQNIISHGFVRDLYRMGTAVKLFGLSHKKEEIEQQIAKLSEETIENIIVNIQAAIDELERTKKLLERRAK